MTLERNSVADIQFRLVYHRAQPGTKLLPFPGMAPVPVFLAPGTYLTKTDFVSARYESKNGNAFVRATLTPQAREKLNNLGAQNAAAAAVEDYVSLLLFVDGEPATSLTMIYEPLPNYEMEIKDLRTEQAQLLATLLGNVRRFIE